MEARKKHIVYKEEFKRQAVEMVIHSGKTQAQVARELGCSEYSLNLWKKAYLKQEGPAEIDGQHGAVLAIGGQIACGFELDDHP
jgi:transposase-like protein